MTPQGNFKKKSAVNMGLRSEVMESLLKNTGISKKKSFKWSFNAFYLSKKGFPSPRKI